MNGVIVGVDEVGRGSWAGPVVVGAVILQRPIAGLKDSKALTKLERARLAATVYEQALAVGLGWTSSAQVDDMGLTAALKLAAEQAIAQLAIRYDAIVLDGSFNYLNETADVTTLVKADALVPAVSAASIVAKVARDSYMIDMAARFPEYGFAEHVGYGTKRHAAALAEFGPCELHRRSFAPIKQLVRA